mgnify:CR=1 FL=1
MMGTSHHTTALYRIWGGSATDTYLANTGGAKAGAALDAFLLQQEMFNNPEFPDEARLFFRKASLYNWWIRARSTSLRSWVDEIRQRRSVNGAFLTAWLLFCAHTSHFFALTMGKIVRLQYNAPSMDASIQSGRLVIQDALQLLTCLPQNPDSPVIPIM